MEYLAGAEGPRDSPERTDCANMATSPQYSADVDAWLATFPDQGQQALSNYQLKIQPITVAHFNQAFKKVRPQTDARLLTRYEDWNGRGE